MSWSNRALGDSWHTIILDVVQLTDTMPVDGSAIVFEVVCDMNHEVITPIGDDSWAWDGAIECEDKTFISIGGKSGIFN
jgi:hypothetical protein